MNIFTNFNQYSTKFLGGVTMFSLLLSALPVHFFMAEAAVDLYTTPLIEVSANSLSYTIDINTTNKENITLSFDFDATGKGTSADGLEPEDTFEYGYRIGGAPAALVELGSLSGEDGTGVSEIGSITNLSLPVSVNNITNLQIYFYVNSVAGIDNVEVTNVVVSADETVTTCAPQVEEGLTTGPVQNSDSGDFFTTIQNALTDCDTEDGDEIQILEDLLIEEEILIDRPIIIDGNGHTITTNISFTDTGIGDSIINIADTEDVTLLYFILDGVGGSNLFGIKIDGSSNVSLEELTILNHDRSAVAVNSSEVLIDSISTNGNVSAGTLVTNPRYGVININKTTSEAASLTIIGDSNHGENWQSIIHVYAGLFATVLFEDTEEQYIRLQYQVLYENGKIGAFIAENRVSETVRIEGHKYRVDKDLDDTPLSDWSIQLKEVGSLITIMSTTTNTDGYYYFDVPKGDYEVHEVMQRGWNQVAVVQNGFEIGANEGGEGYCLFTSDSEQTDVSSCDFYNYSDIQPDPVRQTFIIEGHKYQFAEEGEDNTGLSDWTITATNGEYSTTTTTGADGSYTFVLPAGTWTVSEVEQEGWVQREVKQGQWGDYEMVEGEVKECSFTFINDEDEQSYGTPLVYAIDNEDTYAQYSCDFYNEKLPEVVNNKGGNTGTRILRLPTPKPLVLGASTATSCPFLITPMQMGAQNDRMGVMKLQSFLHIFRDTFEGTENPVTGFFGPITDANVRAFQEYYQTEILNPWFNLGIVAHNRPTGFVYKTTMWKINSIVCGDATETPNLEGEDLSSNVAIN